ncbi:flagellar biosynthesis protein FlhB [Dechloromonas denitrificans]|jgi:flagellar biosynthetic protein FlhB|uniref:flagellar biosynthesis protein FlhB n=1 Tax=Dechloromonas denitrificans TaxID=281362 RepID=UPI001CF82180|nr:flagellar biosynthesis protein FlhB [Dechloromonas denitrificans]UCV04530.1 flagellar type III secretion system protein FlhB [Dechloromonas denitrificans]UCV08860.1 flagellar type III secretion system protein FlhB [Dechloromonas denitrificans]
MAEESDLEKTEEPTGRRIEQAREKGQVPHSRELGTFLVLIAAGAAFWTMGGWFMQRSMAITHKAFSIEPAFMHEPALMLPRLAEISGDALLVFAPLLAVLVLAAILPPFFLNAWVFSITALVPDLNRLNPLSGIGRMFSWGSLMELGKAVLKAGLIGGVAVIVIWKQRDEIFGLLTEPLESGLVHAGQMVTFSFLILVATLVLVVAADVPFQLWQYFDKLKMSKDEVKQEMKEMMGDPHVKGRIRSLQMQAARKRMMAAVPQANVIVTNPTHFAVALSYRTGMDAPKVVAKGAGAVALKIREIAVENAVPIMEAPPLARALYKHANLDAEIPSALYNAVAEVLAYIYQLANWRQAGGVYPVPPRDLPVPPELVPEAA